MKNSAATHPIKPGDLKRGDNPGNKTGCPRFAKLTWVFSDRIAGAAKDMRYIGRQVPRPTHLIMPCVTEIRDSSE